MLPSPIIEGTLPAFYSNEKGIAEIAIPFYMSKAVSKEEVKGFSLKIKYIQNNDTLMLPLSHSKIDYANNIVYFRVEETDSKFTSGAFYKAQLAYIDLKGVTGYYSSVGIIKYTTMPSISIVGLDNKNNPHIYEYTGQYSQKYKDSSEKVYQYRFTITDLSGKIIEDTGYLLHNSSYDTEYHTSKDTFLFNQDLEIGKKYLINYSVKTNNGLEVSSPYYTLISRQFIMAGFTGSLKAELNYDNAYVSLTLGAKAGEEEKLVKGSFILSRSSEETNFTKWEEIDRFNLLYQMPSVKKWKDFTIEQGVRYKYSLQQYNKYGLYSERVLSNIVYADFEDNFLFDGERQLKIRFNPKMSSFKKDILESKVDTIGSQYPFFFRNSKVNYKEFPISGLISYLMDEEYLFFKNDILKDVKIERRRKEADETEAQTIIKDKDFKKLDSQVRKGEYRIPTTNLTSENINLERQFKLEVLNWLTDGKPKLFKSPTEGNYLVRLMNTSLSPSEQLGRLLHTFSSTAYEIDSVNYETLLKYGILTLNDNKNNQYLKMVTIPFCTTDLNFINLNKDIKYDKINANYFAIGSLIQPGRIPEWIEIRDMSPNSLIEIDGEEILIGTTGGYYANTSVSQIVLKNYSQGSLTYGYMGEIDDSFSQILSVDIKDEISRQIFGENKDILKDLENVAEKIISFYDIKARKKIITNSSEEEAVKDEFHLHSYEVAESEEYGQLYCQVVFKETGKMDRETLENSRLPINRTSTNPYLKDLRDFPLYLKEGNLYSYYNGFYQITTDAEFDPNMQYYIKEPTILIKDFKGNVYLSQESYQKFKKMYALINQEFVTDKIYNCNMVINGDQIIDIAETGYFSTGYLDKIETFSVGVGVYLELFYQKQILNYDIAKNPSLIKKKAQLNEYDELLSKKGMLEACATPEGQENYNIQLSQIYGDGDESYLAIYNSYIEELTEYLKELEREG